MTEKDKTVGDLIDFETNDDAAIAPDNDGDDLSSIEILGREEIEEETEEEKENPPNKEDEKTEEENAAGPIATNANSSFSFFTAGEKQKTNESVEEPILGGWPRETMSPAEEGEGQENVKKPSQNRNKFNDTEWPLEEGTSRDTIPEAYANAGPPIEKEQQKAKPPIFNIAQKQQENKPPPKAKEEEAIIKDKRMIGIDLGTTNSLVAILAPNGKVEVLTDSDANNSMLISSCVAYHKETENILVGNAAYTKIQDKSWNTVYDVKRLMGKNMNDPQMGDTLNLWTKMVQLPIREVGAQPLIEVQHIGKQMLLRPQDVSAQVLGKLRKIAEQSLRTRSTSKNVCIHRSVITVPAKFEMPQKAAVLEAAKLAGLTEVRLITEPAAAGYAYGFHQNQRDGYTILVYDFGGGTFDAVIMRVENRNFRVIKTGGKRDLGGRDIDAILVDHVAEKIRHQFGRDVLTSVNNKRQLLRSCVALKEHLSQAEDDSLYLGNFGVNDDLEFTRAEFEELITPIITTTVDLTEQLLADAQMEMEQIDEILLVGGSSKIPLIRTKLIERGFPEAKFNQSMEPEQAVVKGAAVLAALISGVYEALPRMALIEAIPLSIGLALEDGTFNVLIPRNSPIPFPEKHFVYYNVINNQYSAIFDFFEGERKLASKNRPLQSLFIENLTPGKADTVAVQLWIGINENGLLFARAENDGQIVRMELNAAEWMNGLEATDENAIAEQLNEANLFADSDAKELQRQQARTQLMVAIENAKTERPNIGERLAQISGWYYENAGTASVEQFKAKLLELKGN